MLRLLTGVFVRFPIQVRKLPEVDYVQELNKARLGGTTANWNLDRIDQDRLPLDNHYNVVGKYNSLWLLYTLPIEVLQLDNHYNVVPD